ncbi:MAG: hypothetical protein ABSG46_20170 [Candidatus Binataceae bacterium]|jgi:hypothetical protein
MAERTGLEAPRRRTFYPWDDWTDGTTWKAYEGKDFTTTPQNFQTVLHLKARSMPEMARVITGSPEKGIVEFRFIKKEDDASERETSEV